MSYSFNYTLLGTIPSQYLRLDSITGTLPSNTNIILDTDDVSGTTYPVQQIANSVFNVVSGRTNLTSISMANLTTIGNSTFQSCTGLTVTTFPALTTIGQDAFRSCTSLTDFSSNTVTTIGQRAFHMSGLHSVTLSAAGMTSLANNEIFYYCASLTTVTMPNLTSIAGTRIFQGCTAITTIYMPSLATISGAQTFEICSSIASITLPSLVTISGSNTFNGCTGLTTITLNALQTISGGQNFSRCTATGFTSLSLPALTTISGIYNFAESNKLTTISLPSLTTWTGAQTFDLCASLTTFSTIDISSSITSYPDSTFARCGFVVISLPPAITSLGNSVFINNTSLTTFTGTTLTSLGTGTFQNCTSLTNFSNVDLGTTITSYPNNTFYNCRFTTVTLPATITSLGNYTFAKNSTLTYFKKAAAINLSSIGTNTLQDCTSLTTFTNVDFGTTITSYPNYTFDNCRFSTVTLPSNITSLGNYTFSNNSALTAFDGTTLTSSASPIGIGTFTNDTGLTVFTNVYLGPTIQSYPSETFNNTRFTSVTFPTSPVITSLGDNTFSNNPALTDVSGTSLTTMGTHNFELCTQLTDFTKIHFGSGITTYPDYTFFQCDFTGTVNLPSTVTSFGTYVFANNTNLSRFNGPTLVTLGAGDFQNCTSLTDFSNNIIFNSAVTTYPDFLFNNCRFTSVTLHPNITTFGTNVFAQNSTLTYFNGPNLATLGAADFQNCTSLTNFSNVIFKNTVTTFPNNLFNNCRFTTVTLPSNVTTFGNSVFANNTALTSFTGISLLTIGNSTFLNCTSLSSFQSVNLGPNITVYPPSTFSGCNFTIVILDPTITSIQGTGFANNSTMVFFAGSGLLTVNTGAFQNCPSLSNCQLVSIKGAGNTCTIPNNLLNGDSNLKYLLIRYPPSSVGTGAFASLPVAARIVYPETTPYTFDTAYTSDFPSPKAVTTYALPPPNTPLQIQKGGIGFQFSATSSSTYPTETLQNISSSYTWYNNNVLSGSNQIYTAGGGAVTTIKGTSTDPFSQVGSNAVYAIMGSTYARFINI